MLLFFSQLVQKVPATPQIHTRRTSPRMKVPLVAATTLTSIDDGTPSVVQCVKWDVARRKRLPGTTQWFQIV